MNFIFDLETSGLPNKRGAHYSDIEAFSTSRIVSISWILSQGDKITEQSYFVVKPDGFQIPSEAQAIHGISQEQANSEGVDISEVFFELAHSLEHVHSMISYNIEFDINVLRSELHRYIQKEILNQVNSKHHVCCMKKAKEFLRLEKYPKLAVAYKAMFNQELKNAHHAMSDTINCFKCYNKMFPLSKDVFFIKNRKVELTPEQSDVVFAPLNMNISVLASAGSGKTTTITARIKHLIDNKIPEDTIMLTTFTRDSTNDMKQKLEDIFGYKPEVTVGTIDSIARANNTRNNELKDVGEYARNYLNYIRSNPSIIRKYRYLFVDEFQDINSLQFDIIKEFSKIGAWLFVVGDDHQNIYSFRGSSIEYILNFKTLFPNNSDLFKLTYNFRSTREIINFANASIEHNINQIPKKMIPGIPQDHPKPKPIVRYFENSAIQNSYVVKSIMKLIKAGVLLDEIAVLNPFNQSLFQIEELLVQCGIKTVYLDSKSDVRTFKKTGHVCLCTIHKSKGLEWEHVFLINMSDEAIPKTKDNIEEDRRFFYVGVTRAKHQLYIYYAANPLAPYVTRFVAEIPSELYDFENFEPTYISGRTDSNTTNIDYSVTKLIDTLDGDDYIKLKQSHVMPAIDMSKLKKLKLYEPCTYPSIVEQESLYPDFGTFVDVFISRQVANAMNIDSRDKYAVQTLAAVVLEKHAFQIYKLYRANFKNSMSLVDSAMSKPKAIKVLSKDKPIATNHIDIVYDIIQSILQNAQEYRISASKVPVFNTRFLPDDFTDSMKAHLSAMASNKPHDVVIDDIWEVSKCQAVIKSYRRRLLYMGVKPSIQMKNTEIFNNITAKFIPFISTLHGDVAIHEDLSANEVYGELDLRIGHTIIDYKTTVNDEITAPWLLQSLAYKAMYDLTHEDRITTLAWFNPLKGWYIAIDVSDWEKQDDLLNYLLTSSKH